MRGMVWQLLVVLLTVAAIVEAFLLIAVMRQMGGVLLQIRPARVGQVEEGGPLAGSVASLKDHNLGRPAIVLFVSPTCAICRPLVPVVGTVRKRYPEIDTWAAILSADETEAVEYAGLIGEGARLDLQELREAWGVPGTPFAVGVSGDGMIASAGVVNSLDQLESLAESLLQSPVVAEDASGAGDVDAPPTEVELLQIVTSSRS